ncbi:MAG: DUF2164 domain-containing protein [Pseudomonadota bacterium]
MKITDLSDETRDALKLALQAEYAKTFDDPLSAFRAEALLDLVLKTIAPAIYNAAVQDVRAHLQMKLDDLDGEIYLDP